MIALAYCRQSLSQSQDGEQSISTAAQERRIRDSASRDGAIVEAVYQDVDVRGTVASRAGLDALLARVRLGGVSQVWVYDVSRLAREVEIFSALFAQIERAGCRLLSVREPTEERWLLHLHAALAMRERDALSDRVGDAMRERGRLGQFVGNVPAGYERVECHEGGGRIVRRLRPTTLAGFVREAFARYDGGLSIAGLARWMNEPGRPTPPRAPRWSVPSVSWMLRNRVYAGDVVIKASRKHPEIVVPDAHPAIVPRDLWERVQRRLDAAGNRQTPRLRKTGRSWLEGRVFCACGAPMYLTLRRSTVDGHEMRTWVCKRHTLDANTTGDLGPCTMRRSAVGNRRIEPVVVRLFARDVGRMAGRDERALAALADAGDTRKPDAERRLDDVRQRRRKLARSFELADDPSALIARDNELAGEERVLTAMLAKIAPAITVERLVAARRGLANARKDIEEAALTKQAEGLRAFANEVGLRVVVDGDCYAVTVGYDETYARLLRP